jgi:hypothetical protein
MSDDDLFNDDEMELPTMRGNANLDVQDYQGSSMDTDFLTDELQEEVPKRGGGPAPATDIEGTSTYEMMDDVDNGPGINQTTYGNNPWQIASDTGYRPFSQQGTDMSDLGSADGRGGSAIVTSRMVPQHRFRPTQQNDMPSNEDVDPLTEYDRSSYEYDTSEQNVIGAGIFDVEEGVRFRPRDGIFANQFAQPAYIAEEDADGIQQSEMWDSTADNWTVTQVNASGVPLSKRVPALKPPPAAFSPFMNGKAQGPTRRPMPAMKADRTGPQSHIEAFGRRAAQCLLAEAKMMHDPNARSRFLSTATEALGPQMARKAKLVADRLIQMGYKPDAALEDTLAHCVMHATMRDLGDRAKTGGGLPRLDRMAMNVRANQPALKKAASDHLSPLVGDQQKLQADLGAFYHSPAAAGMGEVAQTTPDALAPATTSAPPTGFLTPRNVVIGAAVLGVGYLAATQTEAGQKVTANVAGSWRRMVRKMKRSSRRAARRGKRA